MDTRKKVRSSSTDDSANEFSQFKNQDSKSSHYSSAKECKKTTTLPYANLSDGFFLTSIPSSLVITSPAKDVVNSEKNLMPDLHYLFSKINKRKNLNTSYDKTIRRHTLELRDADLEHWLRATNRFPKDRCCIKQRRILRKLFDCIDADGSGEIDIDELANALLSSGIAKNLSEVKAIVNSVEESEIGFKTFLSLMQPKKKRNNFKDDYGSFLFSNGLTKVEQPTNPISRLHDIQQQNGCMDMQSTLMFKRRKLLIDATMGEILRQELALKHIDIWHSELKAGISRFKKTSDRHTLHKKLNKLQEEKQQFISAIQIIIAKEIESYESIEEEEKDYFNKRKTLQQFFKQGYFVEAEDNSD